MLEIVLLALGLTAVAGLWDLKTTEVPDEIPAIMIISGIAYWLVSASVTGNFEPLIVSLAVGSILLAAGLLLYKTGQWGGADAWVLAGVGYTIPLLGGALFIVPYIMNFFIVSAAYMVLYAIAVGLRHRDVFPLFIADLRKNRRIFLLPLAFLFFLLALSVFLAMQGLRVRAFPAIEIFSILLFLTAFWRYGKVIETNVFRRRIPASRLKEGDVLEGMNWVGLTKRQVARLKQSKKYVTIKEGVRFVPVFFLTLVATLLWGNLLFLWLGI